MTRKQRILIDKHGTVNQFAIACESVYCDLMITVNERDSAVAKYLKEWQEAGSLLPQPKQLKKEGKV